MLDEIALRDFIAEITLQKKEEIGADTPLLSSGLIDSVRLLELVTFIEKKSGVKIRPGDMGLRNFDSISRILSFLASRRR